MDKELQLGFSDFEQRKSNHQTRKEKFLTRMESLVPWATLEMLIEPHYPKRGNRRPPYPLSSMLRIHCLQQWYSLSDPAAEDALYEITSMRRFTQLSLERANTIIYRSKVNDGRGCALKQRCCPNTTFRNITRSIHDKARDLARSITGSEEYIIESRNQRKKIEVLFAHMKRHLNFERLRLRGIKSAFDELLLVATVQNLKRMVKLCGQLPT